MLTSLFGDLGAARDGRSDKTSPENPGEQAFAATPIMDSVETVVDDQGRMIDRHVQDLVVSGSPAQAIRDHFNATRADLDAASRIITLLDPVGMWASAVVKALSDAGGRPIEKLHLRESDSLRTLAMIERTTLARRNEETLKVYHAEVRAPGRENAEIPVALMERSHMTTVIVGPKQPHAIDALLESLREATRLPTWRCPNLLFMLPPNAAWIAGKVGAIAWPQHLRVHLLNESLSSASAVWNAMLGMWNHVKARPESPAEPVSAWADTQAPEPAPAIGVAKTPVGKRADFADTEPFVVAPVETPAAPHRRPVDPAQARQALAPLLGLAGLLGCAVVDATTGAALATETLIALALDMPRVADASAQVLRAQRLAASGMGFAEMPDEAVTSAGTRRLVVRPLARRPELLLVALLDRQLADLTGCRRKLDEVEAKLG